MKAPKMQRPYAEVAKPNSVADDNDSHPKTTYQQKLSKTAKVDAAEINIEETRLISKDQILFKFRKEADLRKVRNKFEDDAARLGIEVSTLTPRKARFLIKYSPVQACAEDICGKIGNKFDLELVMLITTLKSRNTNVETCAIKTDEKGSKTLEELDKINFNWMPFPIKRQVFC